MAAGTFLRLLIVLFCFSHLVCIKAVPITRTRSLTHEYQVHRLPKNNHLAKLKKSFEVHQVIGRMDVELNDYPGSGANNRHTPKPQPGRGCVDC